MSSPAFALAPVTARAEAKTPAKWDPRVEEFVRFVERDRDLEFEHPVRVAFLGSAAFLEELNKGSEPTKQERADAERDAAQLRALGMIGADVDLIDAADALDDTGTVGFYDSETEELFVRGSDLTDTDVRVTVVHELTHALQDQHFDLDRLDSRTRDSGGDFALVALIEGDATIVEDDYINSLPEAEQDEYFASFDEPLVPDDAPYDAVDDAPVLAAIDAAPYDFGYQFVASAIADRGPGAVDSLFRRLPTTEEQIIDPIAGSEAPLTVAVPKLAKGEKRDGAADVFGAYSLYLMLAARIEVGQALAASTGWGGDHYRAFTRDGTECVRLAVRGDTTVDTAELGDALDQWAAALPEGGATVERGGLVVTATACDVGGATAPDTLRIDDATSLLYGRNDLTRLLVEEGAPREVARCAAAGMARDPELLEWAYAEELTDEQEAVVQARVAGFVEQCRGGNDVPA